MEGCVVFINNCRRTGRDSLPRESQGRKGLQREQVASPAEKGHKTQKVQNENERRLLRSLLNEFFAMAACRRIEGLSSGASERGCAREALEEQRNPNFDQWK